MSILVQTYCKYCKLPCEDEHYHEECHNEVQSYQPVIEKLEDWYNFFAKNRILAGSWITNCCYHSNIITRFNPCISHATWVFNQYKVSINHRTDPVFRLIILYNEEFASNVSIDNDADLYIFLERVKTLGEINAVIGSALLSAIDSILELEIE